jgi:hypothetical protein
MIKDVMANNNSQDYFQRLCNNIFVISPNIRFAGVIDKMRRLVAGGMRKNLESGGMRKNLESMENKENSPKLYIEFVLRTGMVKILMRSLVRQFIITQKERM